MEAAKIRAVEQVVQAGVASTARAIGGIGADLTFPQWRVLVVLAENPGGATVSAVAREIGVTLPATSRQLRRLQHRGLVTVEPDASDRRATRARITADGDDLRESIVKLRRIDIAAALDGIELGADVLEQLVDLASRMNRQP